MKISIVSLALVLGVMTPGARRPAGPAAPPVQAEAPAVIPPEPPQPDPVQAEIDRAAAELAAAVERDRVAASLAFQLGRLDVAISAMEQSR